MLHALRVKLRCSSGTNQRADAGSRDDTDRNIFFFENLEDSDVSHASGEASAQSDSNGWEWDMPAEEELCRKVLGQKPAPSE